MKYSDYREQKIHGTPSFPLEYYYVDKDHPQYVMPLHWHGEFEILRVISGRLALYLNNEVFDLRSGDVIFIPSGTLHRGEPTDCAYDCAVFDMRLVVGYGSARISELVSPIISSDAEIPYICHYADDVAVQLLDAVAKREPYYEIRAASLISEILYRLYSGGEIKTSLNEDKRISNHRAIMTLLIDRIEREYTSKLTLADLAETVGMNEKYLCRFFKKYTGQTPIEYINRLRIDRAAFEMTVNGMSVTEAAFECGFNELSYFSKTFKKYKGVTPGKYRRSYTQSGV